MRELAFSREMKASLDTPQTKKKSWKQNDSNELKEKKGKILMKINLSAERSAIMSGKSAKLKRDDIKESPSCWLQILPHSDVAHVPLADSIRYLDFQVPVAASSFHWAFFQISSLQFQLTVQLF